MAPCPDGEVPRLGYVEGMVVALSLWLGLSVASPEATEGVRVATYNVWGLPWPLAPSRKARLRRLGRWAAQRDVDVVALQEVWGPSGRHVHEGLREDFVLTQPVANGDSGLAVLSRRDVDPVGLRVFSARRGPDALKRKGVWWVDVELAEERTVHLGVLHLQAGHGERRAEVRRAQLEDVLDVLPDGPVVLTGDFNLHDGAIDAGSHALLEAHGLTELVTKRPTSRYGRDRLDRFYVRGMDAIGLTVRRARVGDPSELSDHHPVLVDFVVD